MNKLKQIREEAGAWRPLPEKPKSKLDSTSAPLYSWNALLSQPASVVPEPMPQARSGALSTRQVPLSPQQLSPGQVLQLQRAIGNRAVGRLIARNAEQSLQRKSLPEPENKTGLPDHLRSGVESLSGLALDDVRVHYNSPQPAQLNALAYTRGAEIYVGPGQEQHLPHEAWHVVQQKQGRVPPTMQMKEAALNDDVRLEKEADLMGAKVIGQNAINRDGLPENAHLTHKTIQKYEGLIQRFVAITYNVGAPPVTTASATITFAALGTGSAPSVAAALIPSHRGAGHPYHHERGHLIGKQLGGDGGDVNNLVGLSDGTNAPLMADIEGHVRDILTAAGAGSSVWVQVTVSYAAGDYNGPAAAPYGVGMVGKISYNVYDHTPPGNTLLYHTEYPNGVVKNHHVAGCC